MGDIFSPTPPPHKTPCREHISLLPALLRKASAQISLLLLGKYSSNAMTWNNNNNLCIAHWSSSLQGLLWLPRDELDCLCLLFQITMQAHKLCLESPPCKNEKRKKGGQQTIAYLILSSCVYVRLEASLFVFPFAFFFLLLKSGSYLAVFIYLESCLEFRNMFICFNILSPKAALRPQRKWVRLIQACT